ncbi:ribonuclease III [Spirochaetota bacterium]
MKSTNKQNKKSRSRQLNKLQSTMKVKFKNKNLLNRALTHRSYANETELQVKDNERLEYLGDSVLGLVINEYLFKHYEQYPEGNLSKIKSVVVSEDTLYKVAAGLKLGSFLLLGKGEDQSGGRERPSILANTLEAVIGAVYLDLGIKESRKFVLSIMKKDVERIDGLSYSRDPKTALQEQVQKKYKERPIYEVIEECGPDHKKEFTVKLLVNGKAIVTGQGSSKRKAEMDAAQSALEKFENGELDI